MEMKRSTRSRKEAKGIQQYILFNGDAFFKKQLGEIKKHILNIHPSKHFKALYICEICSIFKSTSIFRTHCVIYFHLIFIR